MENVAEQNYRMVLTEREEKAARMRKFVSFAAGMAGLLFGLDIGVISGALPFITNSFALTSQQQEWVVSAMMLGAAFGAVANNPEAANAPDALLGLASVAAATGDKKSSRKYLVEILERFPQTPAAETAKKALTAVN